MERRKLHREFKALPPPLNGAEAKAAAATKEALVKMERASTSIGNPRDVVSERAQVNLSHTHAFTAVSTYLFALL